MSDEPRNPEVGDDVHVLAQVLLHYHAVDKETARDFTATILREVEELVTQRVEETEGIFLPDPAAPPGLEPGDMELSDEDMRRLLNPEGTD